MNKLQKLIKKVEDAVEDKNTSWYNITKLFREAYTYYQRYPHEDNSSEHSMHDLDNAMKWHPYYRHGGRSCSDLIKYLLSDTPDTELNCSRCSNWSYRRNTRELGKCKIHNAISWSTNSCKDILPSNLN